METSAENTLLQTSESSELKQFFDSIPVGHRRPRFEALAEAMISAERPICVLETGCMRKSLVDEPEADGCSTLVWDYVAQRTEGGCISLDINEENVTYAKSKVSSRTQIFCVESVKFLSSIGRISQPVDLLYLDSQDWQGPELNKQLSSLHHAAELSAAWPWIAEGGLIAVDDCPEAYRGKHSLVRRFFDSVGAEPIVDDYIHVWRKPALRPIEL